jgi:hypothetical protein
MSGGNVPARINNIQLRSGDNIDVSDHLTVIVGPNNVGKSVLLGSTWQLIQVTMGQQYSPLPVVDHLGIALPSQEEVHDRLSLNADFRSAGQYDDGLYYEDHYYGRAVGVIPRSQIEAVLTSGPEAQHLGFLTQHLAILLQPESRLGQLGQVQVPNLYHEVPTAPLQKVWADRGLEGRVQVLAKRAFGIDLTLNRHGGAQIGLHVGRPATPEPAVGEPSPYIAEVASLPLAAQQGHGVQAFLGMILTLTSGQYDIVLIDEPEAFLHPPQARLLGEVFVELAKQNTQIIVSTHSDDFLRGVLQASASATEVTIARLTRPEPTVNAVAQLSPVAVRRLFEDALLRYSNILSGIFYKGVVLCEAEGDCQYYAAVLDSKFTKAEAAEPRPDLLFTQCGGKDRFAKAAKALLSTKVPTAIIADIDLLADRSKFEELLTVLGGDPASLSAALNTVESALNVQATAPDRAYTRYRFIESIDANTESTLSPPEVREFRELLKTRSGWELAKKNGVGALPSGNAVDAFNAILIAAKSVGLFILPIGELERFHPEVGGNKQTWLRQVFESSLYTASPEAEEILSDVVTFIAKRQ